MPARGKTSERRARDVVAAHTPAVEALPGRHVVVAIGIDHYRHQRWERLRNAVNDAVGATRAFQALGFEEVVPPLIGERATRHAIDRLATDDLARELREEDSLVVFYAGHGGVRSQPLGTHEVDTGHLIPVDADETYASWIELKPWLEKIGRLPCQHIVVILDACKSGIALSNAIPRTRDSDTALGRRFAAANRRRSRLLITSAGEGEHALDEGPRLGHSLFTGCLLDALTGGEVQGFLHDGRPMTIGSNLGHCVRNLVQAQAGEPGQTPVVGRFKYDDHGEMLIPMLVGEPTSAPKLLAQGSNLLPVTGGEVTSPSGDAAPPDVARVPRRARRRVLAGAVLVAIAGTALAAMWRLRMTAPASGDGSARSEPAEPQVSFLMAVEVDAGTPPAPSSGEAAAGSGSDVTIGSGRGSSAGPRMQVSGWKAPSLAPRPPSLAPRPPSPAPKLQVSAAAHTVSPPTLCPTWFGTPKGGAVEWKHEITALPASLRLPCGVEVELTFSHDHHEPGPRKVTAMPGVAKGKGVRLKPIMVDVTVRSKPPGAQIAVGKKVYGSTPMNIKLPEAEKVSLTLSKRGYLTLEKAITPGVDHAVLAELTR